MFCENSKCSPQKANEGDSCSSHYNCANSRVCIEKKCKKGYFSLPAGSIVNYDFYLCESNLPINNMCTYLIPTDKKDVANGNLTVCEFGQKCNYTLHDGTPYQHYCVHRRIFVCIAFCFNGFVFKVFSHANYQHFFSMLFFRSQIFG